MTAVSVIIQDYCELSNFAAAVNIAMTILPRYLEMDEETK